MDTNQLIQHLARDARPVRPLRSVPVRLGTWLLFSLLFAGMGILVMGIRTDLHSQFKSAAFFVEGVLLGGFSLWAAADALRLSVPGSFSKAGSPWISSLALVAWIFLLLYQLRGDYAVQREEALVVDHEFICALGIFLISLAPSIVLLRIVYRGFPMNPVTVGALAGAANASFAAFGMQFICTHDRPIHVLTWHFLPVVFSGAAGAFYSSWLFRRQSATSGQP